MAIPIITVGATAQMGARVNAALAPEYEVIHFALAASRDSEIPLLLATIPPNPPNLPSPSTTAGTGNWTQPPRAIAFGALVPEEDARALHKRVYEENPDAIKLPWLVVDQSIPRPEVVGNEEGYGRYMVGRFRKGLEGVLERGDKEGVVLI
ncbi:hypothetical protein OQA88_5552 [Cercophora sp. LCS_1]